MICTQRFQFANLTGYLGARIKVLREQQLSLASMEFKTVDEVCALLKARGFDDAVLQEFRGELSETWH